MITRLKTRPRLDALDNQRRGAGKKLGRRIYFGLLVALGLSLVYFFVGARFVLVADGLVMRQRYLVAAEYDSRLMESYIRPGDTIRAGQMLMRLDSRDIANKLSDYNTKRSELQNQLEEIEALLAQSNKLLPLAEEQARRASDYAERVDGLFNKGFTTLLTRNQAADISLSKRRDVAALEGEKQSAEKRLKTVSLTISELQSVIDDTKKVFDEGYIYAPVAGVVGPVIPATGQVNQKGEPILEILSGQAYILAFFPTNRLYSLSAGDTVTISNGLRTARGRIENVGGLTDAVPAEFQNTLKRRERQEIVRITIETEADFPLGSTVSISSSLGPTGLLNRIRTALTGSDAVDPVETSSLAVPRRTVEDILAEQDPEPIAPSPAAGKSCRTCGKLETMLSAPLAPGHFVHD